MKIVRKLLIPAACIAMLLTGCAGWQETQIQKPMQRDLVKVCYGQASRLPTRMDRCVWVDRDELRRAMDRIGEP